MSFLSYHQSAAIRLLFKEMNEEQLEDVVIELSTDELACRFLLVTEKDALIRLCGKYRLLAKLKC